MSGNIGEKARAAFLALIMVTSVMVAGVALTGSAAAVEDPSNEGEFGDLAVIDGPAEPDKDNSNIATTVVLQEGTNLNSTLDEVLVDFGDQGVFAGSNPSTSTSGISLEVIKPDGTTLANSNIDASGTNLNKVNDSAIQWTGLSTGSSDIDIKEGDKIRVTIKGEYATLPSDDLTATVKITEDGTNSGTRGGKSADSSSSSVDLTAELPGPVEVELADGTTTQYSDITTAINQNSSDFSTNEEDTITVGDGLYDERGNTISIGSENVTLQAASGASPTVISDREAGQQLDITAANVTVDGLTFDGNFFDTRDAIGPGAENVQVGVGAADVTLQNNVITTSLAGSAGYSSDDLNFIVHATSSSDRLTLDDNKVTVDSGDTNRKLSNQIVRVDKSNNATLTANNITDTSDTQTEVGVQLGSGAGSDSVHTFENNELDTKRGLFVSDTTEVRNNTFDISTPSGQSDEGYAVATSDSSSSDPTGTVIENNVMTNQGGEVRAGIALQGADKVDTNSNTIEGFEAGILFDEQTSSTSFGVVNITNDEIINSSDEGISIPDDDSRYDSSNTEITIDGVTISDEDDTSSIGIDVVLSSSADLNSIDVTNSEIRGPQTATGIAVNIQSTSNIQDLNITDNQFVNATTGLQVDNYDVAPADGSFNAHFNTFEDNDNGVVTATDPISSSNSDQVLNLTFNDFTDNANTGLDASNGLSDGTINANYSWWGSDAGPNSDGGDSVTASDGDATTEPFLLESAVDNYNDSNLGGRNVLRFGHNVEVTDNKGAVSFPTTANRTAGASIEGDTTDVMVYKLVDGQFIDAGDQVPDTMEGHVIDLTESSRTSAWVTISYSDDVQDGLGGVTYEQGQNLVGPPTQGPANASTVFGLSGDYVIKPFTSNTDDKFEPNSPLDKSKSDSVDDDVSPFDAYIIEVPDADDDLVDRFRGGNIPGGTDASEVEALLTN